MDIGHLGVGEGEIKKVSKGVNKVSPNRFIASDDYYRVLFGDKPSTAPMISMKSKQHIVYSVEQNKLSLTAIVFEN